MKTMVGVSRNMVSVEGMNGVGKQLRKIRVRLNGMRNQFRICFIASFAIAYASAYFLLSSNSQYHLLQDEIAHVERRDNVTKIDSLYESHLSNIRMKAGSISRIYSPSHPSTWCVDNRLRLDQKPRQPMGLCYLGIPHAASATLRGINMRIARNFAQRHGVASCIRHDSNAKGMEYAQRDKRSYLWTFVRNPTYRAMSTIGTILTNQLLVSENRASFKSKTQSNDNILANMTMNLLQNYDDIKNGVLSEGRGGFQLQFGMQEYIPPNDVINPLRPTEIVDPHQLHRHVTRMFKKYDFVGVVERFDESLVVLQLLLGLESSDILYFAVNRKEQWYRRKIGRNNATCLKPFDWELDLAVEPPVSQYLIQSKEWHSQNYGDYLLYHAANLSLDKTILKIGLDLFSQELKKFRQLMKLAEEKCSPVFPCSANGADQFEDSRFDCMAEGKFGCGHRCLDEITA